MRLCREIHCPHPNQFEKFGIGINEMMDWWAFWIVENEKTDGKPTAAESVQAMKAFNQKWGK